MAQRARRKPQAFATIRLEKGSVWPRPLPKQAVNVSLDFGQVARLQQAADAAAKWLLQFDERTREGKNARVMLTVEPTMHPPRVSIRAERPPYIEGP